MHHVTTEVIMHVTPRPLISAWEAATHDDDADGQGQGRENANVNDAYFDPTLRIAVLVSELIVGTLGCLLLCVWLARQRKRKSRINALLCHVNISDLLVFLVATMPQLIWDACGRHWALGLTACRTFKFSQSCVMMASNFMLVVLSVDRHNAIVTPLKPPIQVWQLTTVGWAAAAILSLPHPFMYVLNDQAVPNKTLCESIWRHKTKTQRGLYLSYISVVTFFIPLIAMCYCYVRIFITVATRANSTRRRKNKKENVLTSSDDAILAANCTQSSCLPRAKTKTLKMTIVIIIIFIVCGLPYHILEMIYSFSDHRLLSGVPSAIMGGMAIANSAANPYVVLGFNSIFYKCMYSVTPHSVCSCCSDYWLNLYSGSGPPTSLQHPVGIVRNHHGDFTAICRSPIPPPRQSRQLLRDVNGTEIAPLTKMI